MNKGVIKLLASNVSFALSKPCYNCVGCYSYGDAKLVLDGGVYPSLHFLEGHNVEFIPIKDFNQKLETSYNFTELDFHPILERMPIGEGRLSRCLIEIINNF